MQQKRAGSFLLQGRASAFCLKQIPFLLTELGLQCHQSLLEKAVGPNTITLVPPLTGNVTLSKLFYL